MRRAWTSWLADFLLIFLLAAALIWPLFRAEYLETWGTMEGRYVADVRLLVEHWPHPRWQPLWYGGTRFDYVFPPFLRYGSATVSRTFSISSMRGYRIFTAFFFCVGTAASACWRRSCAP